MKNEMNTEQKIKALKPGHAVVVSSTSAGFVEVQRSGDGKLLRFVRTIGNTSTVFRTEVVS